METIWFRQHSHAFVLVSAERTPASFGLIRSSNKLEASSLRWRHPSLHSFLTPNMSSISDFVSAAGPSGVTFVVLSTTTFVINLGMKALSAEGKVAALRKLLNRTKGAHLEVKANLLSTIPPDFHHDPAFANMDRRSHVLDM